jgi:hypothetical protein
MGIKLIVEVMDHAPSTLTHREHKALIILAEDARDETRISFPRIENDDSKVSLRLRMRRSERYAVLASLVKKGALEHWRRGQQYRMAEYRIPNFQVVAGVGPQHQENPDAEDKSRVRKNQTQTTAQGPDSAESGSEKTSASLREARTPSPQTPQNPSSLSSADRLVMSALSDHRITDEEARKIVEKIQEHHKPKNLLNWTKAVAANGDLARFLDEIRTSQAKADHKAWADWAQRQPLCPHGIAGGTLHMPHNRQPRCVFCRSDHQAQDHDEPDADTFVNPIEEAKVRAQQARAKTTSEAKR